MFTEETSGSGLKSVHTGNLCCIRLRKVDWHGHSTDSTQSEMAIIFNIGATFSILQTSLLSTDFTVGYLFGYFSLEEWNQQMPIHISQLVLINSDTAHR